MKALSLRLPMTRRDVRELTAWALLALVTAVQLHGRTQLALCTTQLEMCRADMRVSADFPLGANEGPLPDVPDDVLAANTAGAAP